MHISPEPFDQRKGPHHPIGAVWTCKPRSLVIGPRARFTGPGADLGALCHNPFRYEPARRSWIIIRLRGQGPLLLKTSLCQPEMHPTFGFVKNATSPIYDEYDHFITYPKTKPLRLRLLKTVTRNCSGPNVSVNRGLVRRQPLVRGRAHKVQRETDENKKDTRRFRNVTPTPYSTFITQYRD